MDLSLLVAFIVDLFVLLVVPTFIQLPSSSTDKHFILQSFPEYPVTHEHSFPICTPPF